MQKETITLQGVDYVVRTLDVRSLPSFEGECYAETTVADHALWDAVERAIRDGDYDACKIDDEIFFYLDSDFINADPTDEQILGYLREHLCSMVPYEPVSEPEVLDFYAIELDDLGQKQISLLGYTYKGDNWKCIDVRGVCLPLSEFIDGMVDDFDYVNSLYQESSEYERDVTDEECVKAMNGFYAGKPADYRLRFSDVCMETPCGNYVNAAIVHRFDDEDDDLNEDEGMPEYVLTTEQITQIYPTYAKAEEGYKLHCDYYEREGWELVMKKRAMNSVNINGETVCALRAVYRKGEVRESVELSIRIECD